MSDGSDVRKEDVPSRQKNVEKNHMLERCDSVGGSKKGEIQMGQGDATKDGIEPRGSGKHQH